MEVFAPILDKHAAAGGFHSWTWLAHNWGGKVRRLLAFDGADHKSLLRGYGEAFDEIGNTDSAALQDFYDICPVHEDYLWDIVHSKP